MTAPTTTTSTERSDLLETLAKHRFFLTFTAKGLSDEQAALTPTVSELCIGGLIKHTGQTEKQWAEFIVNGPEAFPSAFDEAAFAEHAKGFQMLPDDTLDGILADYAAVAAATDELVRSLPSLDVAHPLPEAPWFEAGASWSGPPHVDARHRRDRAARRPRRHRPGSDRWSEVDGLRTDR